MRISAHHLPPVRLRSSVDLCRELLAQEESFTPSDPPDEGLYRPVQFPGLVLGGFPSRRYTLGVM